MPQKTLSIGHRKTEQRENDSSSLSGRFAVEHRRENRLNREGEEKACSQLRVSVSRVRQMRTGHHRISCAARPSRYYLFDGFTSYPTVSSRATSVNTQAEHEQAVSFSSHTSKPDKLFHVEAGL